MVNQAACFPQHRQALCPLIGSAKSGYLLQILEGIRVTLNDLELLSHRLWVKQNAPIVFHAVGFMWFLYSQVQRWKFLVPWLRWEKPFRKMSYCPSLPTCTRTLSCFSSLMHQLFLWFPLDTSDRVEKRDQISALVRHTCKMTSQPPRQAE